MTHRSPILWIALVAALGVAAAVAEDDSATRRIEVGSSAPDFRLNDQNGSAWRLSEQGKEAWTILAFFPKASTPG